MSVVSGMGGRGVLFRRYEMGRYSAPTHEGGTKGHLGGGFAVGAVAWRTARRQRMTSPPGHARARIYGGTPGLTPSGARSGRDYHCRGLSAGFAAALPEFSSSLEGLVAAHSDVLREARAPAGLMLSLNCAFRLPIWFKCCPMPAFGPCMPEDNVVRLLPPLDHMREMIAEAIIRLNAAARTLA